MEIIQKAGSGALDRNPVLAFQNDHSCQTCHAIMNVRFLDYLIAGHFTFGKSETRAPCMQRPPSLDYIASMNNPLQ